MIKVNITTTDVRVQSGTSKTSGKPYSMAFQPAWFFLTGKDGKPEPYPQRVEVILPKADDGAAIYYPLGEYVLDPSSLYVDRQGSLAVAPRLTLVKAFTVTPRAAG